MSACHDWFLGWEEAAATERFEFAINNTRVQSQEEGELSL